MRCFVVLILLGLLFVGSLGRSAQVWAAAPVVRSLPKATVMKPGQRWWRMSYLVDWGLSLALFGGGAAMSLVAPPERPFLPTDPRISLSLKENTLSDAAAIGLATGVPLAIFGLSQLWVRSGHDFHHAALGLFESLGLTFFLTQTLKVTVGRLRPDFLARCQPDDSLQCRGEGSAIRTGRRSFPSGHTSISFAGGVFLSLYLWGKLKPLEGGAFWKTALVLLPLSGAALVGVSRVLDHRHHWEDVLVGALLGTGVSCLTYFLNFSATPSKEGQPRLRLSFSPIISHQKVGLAMAGSF